MPMSGGMCGSGVARPLGHTGHILDYVHDTSACTGAFFAIAVFPPGPDLILGAFLSGDDSVSHWLAAPARITSVKLV